MIGDEQAALAFARPLLKFLKEEPGYGLGSLRSEATVKTMWRETTEQQKIFHVEQKGDTKMTNTQNAEAIRKKAEAEKPFILHKKGEHRHRWNAWNPNVKAMMTQEVIIELWEECSAAPRADGMVEVTTLNRRLEWELEQLHWQQPRKCSRGRKTLGVVASYEVNAELWQAWLAEHTEAEAQKEAE